MHGDRVRLLMASWLFGSAHTEWIEARGELKQLAKLPLLVLFLAAEVGWMDPTCWKRLILRRRAADGWCANALPPIAEEEQEEREEGEEQDTGVAPKVQLKDSTHRPGIAGRPEARSSRESTVVQAVGLVASSE